MEVENLAGDTEDFTGNVWMMRDGDETVLIDVGTGEVWENISDLETVDKVVLTHSHYDHVDNLPKVLDRFSPEIYSYEPGNLPVDSEKISEGDAVELCGSEFEVFHTPGHRDDSICLHSAEEKILFTGDLLFPDGGFGRTDLDQGDRDILIESIEKIVGLDVDAMYCGHEPAALEDVASQIQRSLEQARKKEPKY